MRLLFSPQLTWGGPFMSDSFSPQLAIINQLLKFKKYEKFYYQNLFLFKHKLPSSKLLIFKIIFNKKS